MGDTATTGPNLDQLDGWHAHRQATAPLKAVDAGDLKVVGHVWLTLADDSHFRGGAPHVKGDQVLFVGQFAVKTGSQHPRRRAGFDQPHREFDRDIQGSNPTAGEHQVERFRQAIGGQLLLQAVEILGRQGLNIGITNRGRHPLIFTDLRGHCRG